MPSYRMRAQAVLTVPTLGSTADKDAQARGTNTIDVPIRCKSVTLERNDHLMADKCHISAEYADLNLDPRFLKNSTVQVWIWDAGVDGDIQPGPTHLRFTGILKDAHRRTAEGGLEIDLEFHDYTDMFLQQKPYASNGIPTYNSTLTDAWKTICDHTGYWDISTGKMISNVTALRDRLVFQNGVDPSVIIGEGVPDRLRKFGRISVRHGDSAWDVWQRCVFSLGLISYIDKDQVIVTTSTDFFSAENAPALIYGQNVYEADEIVDTSISNKGIGLVSYDPTTGKSIEAYYPEAGDVRINVKRSVARRKGYSPSDVQSDQYDVYEYHGISNPDILQKIAQRAYEERSRQEIQGYVKTYEPVLYLQDGSKLDVMNLGAGQNIRIEIDPTTKELTKNITSKGELLIALLRAGYAPDVARLVAANLDSIGTINSNMHTKCVTTRLDEEDFEVTIKYWNTIKFVTGDSNG